MTLSAEIRRTLLLATPLILGQMATVGISFVDTLMAGRVDAVTLAAVAIGGAVWSAGLLFIIGVLMAIPPFVSQLVGAGRVKECGPLIHQASYIAAALALLFIIALLGATPLMRVMEVDPAIVPLAAGYLDAIAWGAPGLCGFLLLRMFSEGLAITRATLYFGLLGLAVNIPANYLLIFGNLGFPRLGAVGCGYASALTQWLQFLGILLYIARRTDYHPAALFQTMAAPRWREIRSLLATGLPIGISIFIEGSLFSTVALLMGSLGTTVVAAHQVAINFTSLMFMVPLGVGMAMTVRIGNAIGRGDPAAARRAGLVGFVIVLATQLFSASVMLLLPQQVAALYTNDGAVQAMVVQLLFLAAIFQLPDGLQAAGAGALRGLKDTRLPMLFTLVAYWLVGVPLGYTLGFRFELGAEGMWYGLIAGLSIAALLMFSRFLRLSGRLIVSQHPAPTP